MPRLQTSRASGCAEVRIDYERCSGCGLCVGVCMGAPLYMEDSRVQVDQTRLFGCIGCGHCMAVCPKGCIAITGRDLTPQDMEMLPPRSERAGYNSLSALLKSRRSVRHFRTQEIERDVIDKILAAAATAPMGYPPTDVSVLVFAGRESVQEFRHNLQRVLMKWRWFLRPSVVAMLRPLFGKEGTQVFREFVIPAVNVYLERDAGGEDWFFYNAPLAMFFYTSPYGDPVDPTVAATYAMVAAESLGLGSCMLGFPAWILKYDKELKHKYQLPQKMQPGVALVFGYPEFTFHRSITRRFANVAFWGNKGEQH